MGDFIADCNKKRTEEIAATGVQPGWFVNLRTEYGDVWHEIDSIWENTLGNDSVSCMVYRHARHNNGGVITEYTWFHNFSEVRNKVPSDARIVYCKEGIFGGEKSNGKPLSELPAHHWPKRLKGICKYHPIKKTMVILEDESFDYYTVSERYVENWFEGKAVEFDPFKKEAHVLRYDFKWYITIQSKLSEMDVDITMTKQADMKVIVDGVKYKFQYESKHRHKSALIGHWCQGFLIKKIKGENVVIDCYVKRDTPNNAKI